MKDFTDTLIQEPTEENLQSVERHLSLVKKATANLHDLKVRYKLGEEDLKSTIEELQKVLVSLFKSYVLTPY